MKNTLKNITWLILCLLAADWSVAQKSVSIPFEISQDLATRFPQASAARWEAISGGFEGEWMENGKEVAAIYDEQAHFVMVEREIDPTQLPNAVAKAVKRDYKGAKIEEAESQEHADRSMTYQVAISQHGKGLEVTYDPQGTQRANQDGGAGSASAAGSGSGHAGSGSDESGSGSGSHAKSHGKNKKAKQQD